MAGFAALNNCPKHIKPWEYDACDRFVVGLLKSITNIKWNTKPGNRFSDGVILVETYMREYDDVNIADFESFFKSLCARYKDECYPDDADEDYEES